MTERVIRIATRASDLALWQAEYCGRVLGRPYELVKVKTKADADLTLSLKALSGQGVFVKEVQQAVLDGFADLAVHSAKDLPTQQLDSLVLAAIFERSDPRDALVGTKFPSLPKGARVGTSAPRRQAMLRRLRPDLEFVDIRGNIQTRLEKGRGLDAIVVAKAALDRLGLSEMISYVFEPEELCPQVGQGALAVECRSTDIELVGWLAAKCDAGAFAAVTAERALLAQLGSGCSIPVGAYASQVEGELSLYGIVASPSGETTIEASGSGDDPEILGLEVGNNLLEQGALRLLG
ncbi:MAG: hydroxymethylbilane synthase [Acidimicrobiaceae bacterium]|nr:hydroxymethylbilane synthase [Acidimicrobiaceae bacterium]